MELPVHIPPIVTPLADLHEALESPEQSDKFYADPLWWSAVDEIDRKRLQSVHTAEYRNVKLMVKELLVFTLGFALFVGWIYAQSDPSLAFVQQSATRFAVSSEGPSIDSIDAYWNWVLTDFVSSAYPENSADSPVYLYQTKFPRNSFALPFTPRQLAPSTYLLGKMRLRRNFAKTRLCASSLFATVNTQCFETYATGEDNFLLPVNRTQAVSVLEDLRRRNFIDFSTRQVLIDFPTYAVSGLVTYHSLLLESFPTGLVSMARTATVIPVRFVSWTANIGMALYDVVILGLFVTFLVHTLYLTKRLGFRFVLNLNAGLDLLILALCTVFIVLRVWMYVLAPRGDDALHPENYVDLATVASHYLLMKSILGFIGMAIVFKGLKYGRFFETFRLLSDTVNQALPMVIIYSGLLVFVCLGFTISLHLVGQYPALTHAFSVVIASLFSRILLVNQSWFFTGSLAPAIAMLFIFLVWLGILMLFYGATISAYNLVLNKKHKLEEKRSHALDYRLQKQNVITVFLRTWNLARMGHLGKTLAVTSIKSLETSESPEDGPQEIALDKLPGLVVKKWMDKRQRLNKVVESTLVRQSTTIDQIMKGRSHGSLDHQMSSFSRSSMTDIKSGNSGKIIPRIKGAINQALALPGSHEFELPPPPMAPAKITRMYPIDPESESMSDTTVSVSQLQRLMDEDRTLVRLLGTKKASEVIQNFTNAPASPKSKAPQNTPIEQLQRELYKKLDIIEKSGLSLDSIELNEPAIKELSTELGCVLYQILSEWRGEMAEIGEVVNVLGNGVKGMSGNVHSVVDKYTKMVDIVKKHSQNASNSNKPTSNMLLPKVKLNTIQEQ
jgi:hypothetical protein